MKKYRFTDNNTLLFITLIVSALTLLFFLPNIVEYFSISDRREPVSIYLNQKSKINNHNETQLTEETKENKNYRKLFELYFKGINEKYDINGNKIPGIQPDPNKAIFNLKKLIDSPDGTNNDVLRLAKIHHQGMHNLEPNLEEAEKVYTAILNNCGEMDIRNQAQDGIDNISREKALNWLNLPKDHDPGRINQPTPNRIQPEFDFIADNPQIHTEPTQLANIVFGIIDDETFNINQILLNHLDNDEFIFEQDPTADTKEYNDPQNTHDSQVISTVNNSIIKLKDVTNNTMSYTQIYRDILQHLQNKPKTPKIEDALKSLNRINVSTQILFDTTEQEILRLVWNRIKNPLFDTSREDVKDILIEELASMQEHGETVCPTGRFVRIIDTLNVVDPEISIKPKYAINEEMLSKAASLRENLLDSQTDKHLLERGESPRQNEFDQNLKETIIQELTKDYVETKILSPTQFNTEVNKWIDHI